MASCVGQPIELNQHLNVVEAIHPQEIIDAVESLYAQDAAADYDYGNHRMTNSCAPTCGPVSPRLMAIALYDPQRFQLGRATNNWTQPDVGCPTNQPCIRVTNIIGFFIHRIAPARRFRPSRTFPEVPRRDGADGADVRRQRFMACNNASHPVISVLNDYC